MAIWKPDIAASSDPIYLAIAKAISADVASGRLEPGDQLPTHRELGEALNVSTGTVTRGYIEAVRRGVIRGETGRGTFVRGSESEPAGLPLVPNPDGSLIDLSVSYPIYCEGPDLAGALRAVAGRSDLSQLLRYQPLHGQPRYLEAGAAWVGRYGLEVQPDGIVITAGAQHALSVILSALTKPGDLVLTDELTYPGLIAAARLRDLRLQGIVMDDEGMIPDALRAACRQRNAQIVYCMPTIQNPTSAVMTARRRQELVRIAREYDLLIVEDDAQRLLMPDAPIPISRLAPERSFFIASTSKPLAGGLRIAYVVAPPLAREQLRHSVWATVWMVAPLTLELCTHWIEDGTADRIAERKRLEAQARQKLAGEVLQGCSYRGHPSSYNIWLELPPSWTSGDFAIESRCRGVAVTPASAFTVTQQEPPAAVRVCLGAAANRCQLRTALDVLAQMLHSGKCCRSALV